MASLGVARTGPAIGRPAARAVPRMTPVVRVAGGRNFHLKVRSQSDSSGVLRVRDQGRAQPTNTSLPPFIAPARAAPLAWQSGRRWRERYILSAALNGGGRRGRRGGARA